jgi:peptidoglycan hydrolase-like protein with peptidoglycan-binding domain
MGTTVDLVTNWDYPSVFNGTVMSDHRNFDQPRETSIMNTVPTDLNMADTAPVSNPFVKQVQTLLRNNPIGPSYLGPIDGITSLYLLDIVKNFQNAVSKKAGKPISIVSGNSISPGAFAEAMKILKEPAKIEEKSAEKPLTPPPSSDSIKPFQSFFATAQPVIGKLYSGPIDGIVNPELESAAKKAEAIISGAIKKDVSGVIWNNNSKTFNTTIADIAKSLQLIASHNASKIS